MAKLPEPMPVQLTYVDHPEIAETFVDSMEKMMFDGASLRMEFVVNRLDDPKPPLPPTGKKHTACRLVLSAAGLPDFANKIVNLMTQLAAHGVVQNKPTPVGSGKPN